LLFQKTFGLQENGVCLSYGSPKKNCFKTLAVQNKINDDIVFPTDREKNILKVFRFATKPMTVLSFP
jgi:hypothetical protein